MRRLAVVALIAALATALPAMAQPPQMRMESKDGKSNINMGVPAPARSGEEAAWFDEDLKVYAKAVAVRSFDQVVALEPELKTVMEHAPKSFPMAETRPSMVIVRDRSQLGFTTGLLYALVVQKANPGAPVGVAFEDNVYGTAALMLGSIAVERKDFAGALAWLDKGIAIQPDNPGIISERAHALMMLGRTEEALAVYRSWELDYKFQADFAKLDTARIQRGIAYALVEQGKLDEAEAALKRSLELEPGNKTALGELSYISNLRRGGQKTAPTSVRPGALQAN